MLDFGGIYLIRFLSSFTQPVSSIALITTIHPVVKNHLVKEKICELWGLEDFQSNQDEEEDTDEESCYRTELGNPGD